MSGIDSDFSEGVKFVNRELGGAWRMHVVCNFVCRWRLTAADAVETLGRGEVLRWLSSAGFLPRETSPPQLLPNYFKGKPLKTVTIFGKTVTIFPRFIMDDRSHA